MLDLFGHIVATGHCIALALASFQSIPVGLPATEFATVVRNVSEATIHLADRSKLVDPGPWSTTSTAGAFAVDGSVMVSSFGIVASSHATGHLVQDPGSAPDDNQASHDAEAMAANADPDAAESADKTLTPRHRTYFVNPSGNDSHDGRSPARALRSLSAVNQLHLMPGDIVALEGGARFEGQLVISDSGSATLPIHLTSYATPAGDRAEILARDGDGILIHNAEHVRISKIKITGSGPIDNRGHGLTLRHDDEHDRRLSRISIDEVEVSGFRYAGIALHTGGTLRYGYEDVRITNVDVHDNGYAGMWTGSAPGNYPGHPETYAYENVYVGYSRFHDNHGLDIDEQTGNGILFKDVNGGVIEYCLAYNNGALNRAPNGPVGIWAFYSTNVVIQFNESFGNRTRGRDGGGFDLDGGTANSILQYNYSHDNDGAGFLVYQYADTFRASSTGNIVRYNISENDSRKENGYGAIEIVAHGSPQIGTAVYGNTIFLNGRESEPANSSAIRVGGHVSEVHIANNIFVTTGGLPLVDLQPSTGTVYFQGNAYWSGEDPFHILSSGSRYHSLHAWRTATNQEMDGTIPAGLARDPALDDPGMGGTVADPTRLGRVTAYHLRKDSPLIDRGVDLYSLLGSNPGSTDFFGNHIPHGAGFDIGAYERPY